MSSPVVGLEEGGRGERTSVCGRASFVGRLSVFFQSSGPGAGALLAPADEVDGADMVGESGEGGRKVGALRRGR